MNTKKSFDFVMRSLFTVMFAVVAMSWASADPLPGRDVLKFSQAPMDGTSITNPDGTIGLYFGHDELSTAWGPDTGGQGTVYQGRFMADDFADTFSSPVVHVKWWGSYLDNVIVPGQPVDKFLISFEEDVPVDPVNPFSHPGTPLLNQVVTRAAALAPGSGTFTEKFKSGGGDPLFEDLYEYNAELHFDKPFPQDPDTVYWLKIVALVDLPPGVVPGIDPVTQWGWHNRDYTVPNPLASPAVVPGEFLDGMLPAGGEPVFHFQDDAVEGDVVVDTTILPGGLVMPDVFQDQATFNPTRYLDGADGPGPAFGLPGIGQFSKDLAFELYTVIPEPATCMLMLIGLGVIVAIRGRSDEMC